MQQLALYLIKVIACTGILLLYYKFVLRNKRFHYYNRFYLLATVTASLLLPLLNINWFTITSSNYSAIALLNVINVKGANDGAAAITQHTTTNWQQVSVYTYSAISVLLIGLLLWRIHKIYAFKKRYKATSMGEFDFINTDLSQAPFSFLQNLFWRNDIDLNDTTGRQILQHELTHIRQKHSWDKLFMQMLLSLFWINPFYWFIQKELYMLHEFIADEKAIENNDGAAFAAMLLTSQYGKNAFSPASPFAYSPIKRRLFMLTNLTKPRYSYARRLMVLPLLATVVLLFAFKVQHRPEITIQDVTIAAAPFRVVIDAGHGGEDPGLQVGLAAEKDITLTIAKKIQSLSSKYNIEVVLTRNDDGNIGLKDRVSAAQGAGAFVSIHLDNSDAPGGISTYVSKDNKNFAGSKLLGSAVMESLGTTHKLDKTLKQRQEAIYVLKFNPAPAILVECGVMKNEADIKKLSSDAEITYLAEGILQGLAKFANNTATGMLNDKVVNESYNHIEDTTHPAKVVVDGVVLYSNRDTARPQPLIIIDGKEQPVKTMQQISPNTIESICVLKDKTALEKYGKRGANGVIEIYLKPQITISDVKIEKDNTLKLDVAEKPVQIKLMTVNPKKTQVNNEFTIVADSITFKPATDTLKLKKP